MGRRERQGEREGGQPPAITWARWDILIERYVLSKFVFGSARLGAYV